MNELDEVNGERCYLEHVSETVCEVNYDSTSYCIVLSGQMDDVRQAETDFRKKCLAALYHDVITVSQPGIGL